MLTKTPMKLIHCITVSLLLVSVSAAAARVKTEDEAIKLAIEATHKYRLTTLNDDCVLVYAVEKHSYFDVTLRERHTQRCGGDPETGPRLFNVRVRKRDGGLTSDAYDGVTYRPLNRKLKPSR